MDILIKISLIRIYLLRRRGNIIMLKVEIYTMERIRILWWCRYYDIFRIYIIIMEWNNNQLCLYFTN